MSFFFNRGRPRTNAAELARQTHDLLARVVDGQGNAGPNANIDETLPKYLSQIKGVLQGTPEAESSPEQVYQLVHSLVDEQVLRLLPGALRLLPFESRKDAQVIFSIVFRYRPPGNDQAQQQYQQQQQQQQPHQPRLPPHQQQQQQQQTNQAIPLAVDFVTNHAPSILISLCHGYDYKESATTAGAILREVLKHEAAAAVVLYDDGDDDANSGGSAGGVGRISWNRVQSGRGIFWQLFRWIDTSSFEVAADAFSTFRELLTRHKELVARYLGLNFERFFSCYNATLVQSPSYVTKRQSIKLLGELLLDRANYGVMTRYVDSGEHLKICMNLLRDERKMVQYEGFHVFKVFVANPNKSVAVQKILIMNREKLLGFLAHFLEERTEDEQFIDEREFLIKQIRTLPPKPVPPPQR